MKRKPSHVFSDPCPGDEIEHNGELIRVDCRITRTVMYTPMDLETLRQQKAKSIFVEKWRMEYGAAKVIKIAQTAPDDVLADAEEATAK